MWCAWTKHLDLSLPGPQRESMEEEGAGQEFTLPALHRSQRIFFEVMFKCHPIETDVDKFRTISLEGVGKMWCFMTFPFPSSRAQPWPLSALLCLNVPFIASLQFLEMPFCSSQATQRTMQLPCVQGDVLYINSWGGCKSAPPRAGGKLGVACP